LAWNIGTIGSTRSWSDSPIALAAQNAMLCRYVERWLYTTPLGIPVVPLV
jgi:hypothetical protein